MYHIKLVDRLSGNEVRNRVYPALRYSIVDKKVDMEFIYKLTFWTDENVCTQVYVTSDSTIETPDDAEHIMEAYVMNDNGKTIEVMS